MAARATVPRRASPEVLVVLSSTSKASIAKMVPEMSVTVGPWLRKYSSDERFENLICDGQETKFDAHVPSLM